MKTLLAVATLFLPMCAVTGDNNKVTTTFNINVSIVPPVEQVQP
jgi:hypothetical protein